MFLDFNSWIEPGSIGQKIEIEYILRSLLKMNPKTKSVMLRTCIKIVHRLEGVKIKDMYLDFLWKQFHQQTIPMSNVKISN